MEPEFLRRRLNQEQAALARSVLKLGDELDETIGLALGVRRLTDDEREHLRYLLVRRLTLGPDGEPDAMGKAVDEVIGVLMWY